MITPTHDLMIQVRQAFLDHGYDGLTMIELAKACGFTRRALYYYFRNKEEAFRASIRHHGDVCIAHGLEAGAAVRLQGGSAVDILTRVLDMRYGETRRGLNLSVHSVELNAEAFRRCRDIMIEAAVAFHTELEGLIRVLVADGSMTLRPGMSAATLAQVLSDGARGVNQSLPPIASDDYAGRYRQMVDVVLFGASIPADARTGRRKNRDRVAEAGGTTGRPG